MQENPVLTYIVVFLVVFVPYLFLQFFMGKRRRLPDDLDKWNLPPLFRRCFRLTDMFADTLGRQMEALQVERTIKIKNHLVVANIKMGPQHVYALEIFMGIFGFVLPIVFFMLIGARIDYALMAGLLFGFIGLVYPGMIVAKAADERQTTIIKNLPFAIDLIGSAMGSGLDFTAAVRYYVTNEKSSNPLVTEFGVVLKQMELGKTRVEALEDMAARIQSDEFTSFTAAVAHGTEIGASIVDTIKMQGEELRKARFNIAERKAARAPSIMILPIVLFIMPAIFIIIATPVYLKIQSSGLGGIMGGK